MTVRLKGVRDFAALHNLAPETERALLELATNLVAGAIRGCGEIASARSRLGDVPDFLREVAREYSEMSLIGSKGDKLFILNPHLPLPIETAPRDGTEIVGFWEWASVEFSALIRWVKKEDWAEPNERDEDGWWKYVNSVSQVPLDGTSFESAKPTHWLPYQSPFED